MICSLPWIYNLFSHYPAIYIPTNYSILKPNSAFPSHFLVAKFATIIAILHNNQANKPSWNQRLIYPLLSSLSNPPYFFSILLSTFIIAAFFKNLTLYIHGRNANNEKRQEDLIKFIKNLNFAFDSQVYVDENQKLIVT